MKIIKIPFTNGLGKTHGTEKFPNIIEIGQTLKIKNLNLEQQEKAIQKIALENLNEKTLYMGGDHSLSYHIAKPFFKKNPKSKLIVFDAHPDLMPPMKNPTHEEWLRALIENTKINPENIMLIGIRKNSKNIDPQETKYANEKSIKIIHPEEFNEQEILDFSKNSKIYLSFDIDCLDESIANATGYPEKNGLNIEQAKNILKKIKPFIQKADIVEINPTKENPEKTIKSAKEILEILK